MILNRVAKGSNNKEISNMPIDIDAIRDIAKEIREDAEWGDPVGPSTMTHYADMLERAISEAPKTKRVPVEQGIIIQNELHEEQSSPIRTFVSTPSYYDKPNETVKKQEAVADILEDLTNLSAKQIHHVMTHDKYVDRMGGKGPFDHDAYKAANYIHRAITGKWISEVREKKSKRKKKG